MVLQKATITKTRLYSIDPLKPHFYIVKLGFTGVYIIFVISAQKHRLWVLDEAVLTSTHNLCFEQKCEKYWFFYVKKCHFLVVKFSVYLNRRVFVMHCFSEKIRIGTGISQESYHEISILSLFENKTTSSATILRDLVSQWFLFLTFIRDIYIYIYIYYRYVLRSKIYIFVIYFCSIGFVICFCLSWVFIHYEKMLAISICLVCCFLKICLLVCLCSVMPQCTRRLIAVLWSYIFYMLYIHIYKTW